MTLEEHWTSSRIEDQLFYEMRSLKPRRVMRVDLTTGELYLDDSTNKYDFEADTYTNRLVFGDFSDSSTERPVFRLDPRDFSSELKVNLAERIRCGKRAIHRVVQNAVYRLIMARHQDDYLEHIKDKRLNWRFV